MRTAMMVAVTGAACLPEGLGQVMKKCLQIR